MTQLALPLRLADHAVFASFHAGDNETVVAALQALADGENGPGAWIWGPAASGKSHLLQATCERCGDEAVYLPLGDLVEMGPEILDGLAARALLCIDDIDAAWMNPDWEQALFNLYNDLAQSGGRLVVAANASPRSSGIELPDLQSRMTQLATFQLHLLDDSDAARALQLRARHRGLELPDDTAQFLLSRSRRDMASLYALLDRLDTAALQAQRRLTIPFVKTVLSD